MRNHHNALAIAAPPALKKDPAETEVLILDDDTDICELLKGLYKKWGFVNTWVSNCPREAAELMSSMSFDLLLVDYHMPHQNGECFVESALATAGAEAPKVILITGDPFAASRAKDKDCYGGIIGKPYDKNELRSMTMRLLGAEPDEPISSPRAAG